MPEVVHVEPFDQVLGRSVLVMGEIAGAPLAQCRDEQAARRVAHAAGRELAVLNGVRVQGFGWVERRAPAWPLRATFRDYGEFVVSYLPDPWPGPLAALFSASELDRLWSLVATERRRAPGAAWLAHGDFDATPIFQADGRYTGLIDFGEIRGTEPLFDLGHFLLHDQESMPLPLFDDLLAGYAEVVALRPATRSWFAGQRSCLACGSSPGGWDRSGICGPAILPLLVGQLDSGRFSSTLDVIPDDAPM